MQKFSEKLWLWRKMLHSEKDFQEVVITYARLCGWDCYHDPNSRHSVPGFPDLILVRNGDAVFCELKTMTGQLSLEQWQCITALRQHQYEAYVWRPSDWTAIRQRLSVQ